MSLQGPSLGYKMDDLELPNCNQSDPQHLSLGSIITILRRFTKYVTQHPRVIKAPSKIRRELSDEIYRFLLAHISHIRYSKRPTRQLNLHSNGAPETIH